MSEELDFAQTKEAWDRLAHTSDGLVIYRHLQRIRQGVAPENVSDSALPRLEGRRSLAADLMSFMADGIRDYDRACVTYTIAKPAPSTGTRGAGRRVTADTYVGGYDTADSFGPGTGGTRGNGAAG
jgi:hypothetical protein